MIDAKNYRGQGPCFVTLFNHGLAHCLSVLFYTVLYSLDSKEVSPPRSVDVSFRIFFLIMNLFKTIKNINATLYFKSFFLSSCYIVKSFSKFTYIHVLIQFFIEFWCSSCFKSLIENLGVKNIYISFSLESCTLNMVLKI